MTAAAQAIEPRWRFRAEQRPPESMPYNSMLKYRVVAVDEHGNAVMVLTLRATLQQANDVVARLESCPGCVEELISHQAPSHAGSIYCTQSIRGGGRTAHCRCGQCMPWGAK